MLVYRFLFSFFLGFLVVFSSVSWGMIQGKFLEKNGSKQLILTQDTARKPKITILSSPPRLVVDFSSSQGLSESLLKKDWRGTPIKRMRVGSNKQRMRLVFDLKNPLQSFSFSYRAKGARGTLTLNLKTPKALPPKILKSKKDLQVKKDFVVVIDPGHGGHDVGARGRLRGRWKNEKDIVLAFSKTIAKKLNQKAGFKAYLTRSTDKFIPLRGRLLVAKKRVPDLFISIHANSFKNSKVRGTAPFILSLKGADSEQGRLLSHSENAYILANEPINLSIFDNDVQGALLNLSKQSTILASRDFAKGLLGEFRAKRIKLLHNRVEKAAFVVLKSLDVPSSLIEVGFMSSPEDLQLMLTTDYRVLYSGAVVRAIDSFSKKRRKLLK